MFIHSLSNQCHKYNRFVWITFGMYWLNALFFRKFVMIKNGNKTDGLWKKMMMTLIIRMI